MADKNSSTTPRLRYLRWLRWLHYVLLRIHFAVLNYKKFALPLLILVFLFFGYWSTRTLLAVRSEDFGDPKLASYKDMVKLKEEYAFEDKLTLLIKKDAPLQQEDLCRIYSWLEKEVNTNQEITNVTSLFDLRAVQHAGNKLHYPLLIKDPCYEKGDLTSLKRQPLFLMFSNPDFTDFMIHLEIRAADVPTTSGKYDFDQVEEIIERAQKDLPYEVLTGGTLYLQSSVRKGIFASDFLNLIAAIILFGGYFFFYRTYIGAFALVGVIAITSTIIKGGMALMGHALDPLMSCIFILIMVAILEDFILLSFAIFKKRLKYNAAIKSHILPSFLTSLTTAIGFGSLSVSDNPSIVHFAWWTAFGAMFEWAMLFLIIPALVNHYPKIKTRLEAHKKPEKKIPAIFSSYGPGAILTVIISIIPVSLIFFHGKGNLDYNPLDLFKKDHPLTTYRDHLQKTRQFEGEISIVFKDKNIDLTPYMKKIKNDPMIIAAFSPLEIEKHYSGTPAYLHSMIKEDFNRGGVGKLFESGDSKRIIAYIKSFNSKYIPALQKRLDVICQNQCWVASEALVSNDYALGVLETLYESFFSGFTFILMLITWLVLAINRRYLLPVIVSTVWASMTLLLLVVVFQVKINIVSCVALSVLIGAAGDNAIQYLLFKRESLYHSVKELGEASSETFILMIGVSLSMTLSYFETVRGLSGLLICGIVLMFIGDLWILSGLTSLWDKIFRKSSN